MHNKLFLAVCLILTAAASLQAESLTLDRDRVLSLALQNNTDLLNKAVDQSSAERAWDNRGNQLYPSLDLSLQAADSFSISASSTNNSSITPKLSAGWNLPTSLDSSVEALRLNVESAKIDYQSAKLELLKTVEIEFYYLLTALGSLEINRQNIDLAERLYEQTKVKFDNGLTSELEVLQARVNAANLLPAYSTALSAYENRLKSFLLILGLDPDTEVSLSGELNVDYLETDGSQLAAAYLENRTDIRTQQIALEKLQNNLESLQGAHFAPSLNINGSVSETVNNFHTAEGWQNYTPGIDGSLSISLSFGLDRYFPGSASEQKIAEAEDSIEKTGRLVDDTVKNALLEINNLNESLKTDRENIELSELNLELSKTSYEMTMDSYMKGTSTRLSLDNSRQDLLTAEQNLLENRYNYIKDLITLRSALGLEEINDLYTITTIDQEETDE